MKSYKTTIIGLLLAICIALQPYFETNEINYKSLVIALLVAILSYFAKDKDVSGENK